MTSTKHQPSHDLIDLERIFAIYYEGYSEHNLSSIAIPENSPEYHSLIPPTTLGHIQASDPRFNEYKEPGRDEKQLLHLKANDRIREGARARLLKRGITFETDPLKPLQVKYGDKCHKNKRASNPKRARSQKADKKTHSSRTPVTRSNNESSANIDEWREFFSSLALEQSLDLPLQPYKRPREAQCSNMSATPFKIFDIFEDHLEKPRPSDIAINNDNEFYELIDLLEDTNSMSTTFEFPNDPSSFDFL